MGGGGQVRPAKDVKFADPAREQKEFRIPALDLTVAMGHNLPNRCPSVRPKKNIKTWGLVGH